MHLEKANTSELLYFCSKDEIISFFLSSRTSFLEPMTHEICRHLYRLRVVLKVEEVGEVFSSV